ncbi:MAG TPA: Abi-alpha family protein [Terracidiphilus sp.]|nr:Abi-alpha family protein [Terracidiphilus sp.]
MTSEDGSELLKITGNVTDLLHRLGAPSATQIGLMLGDELRDYRVKRWIKVAKRTQARLHKLGLSVNTVPPKLLVPIIDNCSLEDDESLQELWAGLLATASQQADVVSRSFIETLKQLTPEEARYMDKLFKDRNGLRGDRRLSSYAFAPQNGAPRGASETFERLGLIRRDYVAGYNTITRNPDNDLTVEDAFDPISASEVEVGYWRAWTDYAIKFWKACHGPRKPSASKD